MPEPPSTTRCSSDADYINGMTEIRSINMVLWNSIEDVARRWNPRKTREVLKDCTHPDRRMDVLQIAMKTPQRDDVKVLLKEIEKNDRRVSYQMRLLSDAD